jgi:hypothetical protein
MLGSCEHGDERPGSIKGEKFLDQLGDFRRLCYHIINYDNVEVQNAAIGRVSNRDIRHGMPVRCLKPPGNTHPGLGILVGKNR